jgi:hypothetical protein
MDNILRPTNVPLRNIHHGEYELIHIPPDRTGRNIRALHHLDYLNMTPKMVDQWCDNLQAVKDTTNPIRDPSGMLKAEADIILAIHHIKNRNPYQTRIRHVYGHQDTKKPKPIADTEQPRIRGPKTPPQVLINIACDTIATATSKHGLTNKGHHPPLPPILTPPYEGSRAMLQINNIWITSHFKRELYKARRTTPMEEYLKTKYNWSKGTLNNIYWPSIKTVRQHLSHTKRMQTCKIMHGWLPVSHMRHHITGVNQCPGCKHRRDNRPFSKVPAPIDLSAAKSRTGTDETQRHQTKDTKKRTKRNHTNTSHPYRSRPIHRLQV